MRVGHGNGMFVNSGQHLFSGNNGSWKSWYNQSDDGTASGIGLRNNSGTDLAWVYANASQMGFLNPSVEDWRFRVETSGITKLNSHGAQLVNGNVNQNLKYIAGANSSDIGITGYNSGGTWKFQLYGATNTYGFLDANWGSWDIKKTVNGNFQVDEGSGLQRVWNAGNDGSGSGLDSDKLDGQEGSYYRNASNLNAGTIPAARVPTLNQNTTGNAATASDAALLDGLDSSQFLRSDNSDVMTGNFTLDGNFTMSAGHPIIHNSTPTRDKIRLWTSSNYAIGMDNAMTFGGLNDYAMTFQMNNESDRGWVFLDDSHTDAQGAMSLTTQGKMALAHSLRLAYGESDTTTPGASYRLDVNGTGQFL